ncbi:transcriptional regulator [Photobacterium sp. GB-1]|nr:transcriptional regulator [Photobacterium sp. GB-1]
MVLYNPIKNTISNRKKILKIGYRDSQILYLLLKHSPNVVPKKDIIKFAWGSECIGETSLAKSISKIRLSLIKLGIKESPIVTVPKVGYRLIEGVLFDEVLNAKILIEKSEKNKDFSTDYTRQSNHGKRYRPLVCSFLLFVILISILLVTINKGHSINTDLEMNTLINKPRVSLLNDYPNYKILELNVKKLS